MSDSALLALQTAVRDFARERDWEQFHTPKNLAMALAVEASELQEIFQWLTPEESAALTPEQRLATEEEMADVLLYLCRMADVLNIDLIDAAKAKMIRNAFRYPADQVRGSATKTQER